MIQSAIHLPSDAHRSTLLLGFRGGVRVLGAECRSRTCDLRFRRPALYPAELIPRVGARAAVVPTARGRSIHICTYQASQLTGRPEAVVQAVSCHLKQARRVQTSTHSMISASRSSRSALSSLMVLWATLTPALSTDCGSPVSSGCHCGNAFPSLSRR